MNDFNNAPPIPQPSGSTCSNCGAAQSADTTRCFHCGARLGPPIVSVKLGVNPNCLTFFLTVSAFFIGLFGFLVAFSASSFVPVAIVIIATTVLLVCLCIWRIRQIIKSP